ncbi:flippase-like domain-containing protein [Bacillaceae bacterium Marseille-Q3522]|nr:flippase-like domain-containing protein [Bacillaceae bacterium Marseille-Q3522]
MLKRTKQTLINLAIILLISLGFIVFKFRDVNPAELFSGIKEINLFFIFLAMLIMLAYWLLESLVLYQMSHARAPKRRFVSAFQITMIGQFFNTITPMQTGGQPAQLYMLQKHGVDVGSASSILLIKFVIFQAMLVVNFVIILFFGYKELVTSFPQMSYLVLIGFVVHLVVIIFLLIVAKSKKTAHTLVHFILKPLVLFVGREKRNKYEQRVDKKVDTFHEESKRIGKNWRLIITGCILTSIQLFLFFSIPYFILESLGISHGGFFAALAFHAFIIMFSSIVPTPSGTGGAEYSFAVLFGSMMGKHELLIALILWRLISSYSCLIFGGIALSFGSRRRKLDPSS